MFCKIDNFIINLYMFYFILISSIIVTIIVVMAILVSRYNTNQRKLWLVGDYLLLSWDCKHSKSAASSSSRFTNCLWSNGPIVKLIKWSDSQLIFELGDGSQYFGDMSSVSKNLSKQHRDKHQDMDSFMQSLPSKQNKRDESIDEIIG